MKGGYSLKGEKDLREKRRGEEQVIMSEGKFGDELVMGEGEIRG